MTKASLYEQEVVDLFRLQNISKTKRGPFLSTLSSHSFLEVSGAAVLTDLKALEDKFRLHSQPDRAVHLAHLVDSLQAEQQTNVLKLILELAYSPTNTTTSVSPSSPEEEKEKEETVSLSETILHDLKQISLQDDWFASDSSDIELSSEEEVEEEEHYSPLIVDKPQQTVVGTEIPLPSSSCGYALIDYSKLTFESAQKEEKQQETKVHMVEKNVMRNPTSLQDTYAAYLRVSNGPWLGQSNVKVDGSDYLKEYTVVKSIMYMLLGIPSNLFELNELRPDVSSLPQGKAYCYQLPRFSLQESERSSIAFSHLTSQPIFRIIEDFIGFANDLMYLRQFVSCVRNLGYKKVDKYFNESEPYVCRTLEGFAYALQTFISEIKDDLVHLQNQLLVQHESITLIQLMERLTPIFERITWLREITDSTCLPYQCIFAPEKSSPAKLAHQILNQLCIIAETQSINDSISLMYKFDDSTTSKLTQWNKFSIAMKLFFSSLSPYLLFLGEWICSGTLGYQSSEEFFISKDVQPHLNTENSIFDIFADPNVVPAFLHPIQNKILNAGKEIYIVRKLYSGVNNSSKFTMNYLQFLFFSSLLKTFPLYHCSSSHDDLIQAMVGCDCSLESASMTVNLNHFLENGRELLSSLDFSTVKVLVPSFKTLIDNCVSSHIRNQCSVVSKELCDLFKNELNIIDHFKSLRSLLLMENEESLREFRDFLFQKLNNNDASWANSLLLNSKIQSSISSAIEDISPSQDLVDSGQFVFITLASANPKQAINHNNLPFHIDSLKDLEFQYSPPWPLQLMFGTQAVDMYNKIAIFLFQIKRAESNLIKFKHGLRSSLKDIRQINSCQVNVLTFRLAEMIHFVRSIHSYVMNQVLHQFWPGFLKSVQSSNDIESISSFHHKYLNSVMESCFLLPKHEAVLSFVRQMLNHSLKFVQKFEYYLQHRSDSASLSKDGIFKEALTIADKFRSANRYVIIILTALYRTGAVPHLGDCIVRLNFNNFFTVT